MKCPHFKKINFQRIKEVQNEDIHLDDDIGEGSKVNEEMSESLFE